jgi:hypothetical protein
MSYATHYWWKVCHDGYICTKKNAPGTKPNRPYVKVDPETYFGQLPGLLKQAALSRDVNAPGQPGAIVLSGDDIEDCSHFISCCLGPLGGGLTIASEFPTGPYGSLAPKKLLDYLTTKGLADILGTERTRSREIPGNLQEGDLIVYWNGKEYQHCAMYLGNRTITCHTDCRWLANWDVGLPNWTFLHVK